MSDGTRDEREGAKSTGRMLVGLTVFAVFMTFLGIAVVWTLTYGPLG
jgi:hypothetical protein